MRTYLCILSLLAALLLASLAALRAAAATKPNIILILADDLGSGHVGWQNPKVKTPHLDRVARAGVQLNRHYVAPVCSPTRVALLTGRYWSRFGCNNALPSELDSTVVAMPAGTPTLSAALQPAGYRTALIGKWHLGASLESGPEKFGFDHFYGHLSHQLYWAAISHLDEAVGRVVAAVDRLGQRNSTMFIFLSDNGAPGQPNRMQVKQNLASYPKVLLPGDNLPFRGAKG
jgi:arylsulfatase A-like enzyme